MLERSEIIAGIILLVVLLVCGISTFFLGMAGKAPFAVEYSQDATEGSLVHLQGMVQKVTPLQSGKYGILTVSGVQVFLSQNAAKSAVATGDRVSLYGTVQVYNREREVVVSSPEDISIIG